MRNNLKIDGIHKTRNSENENSGIVMEKDFGEVYHILIEKESSQGRKRSKKELRLQLPRMCFLGSVGVVVYFL